MFLLISFLVCMIIAGKLYVEKKFREPYKITELLIEDARLDKESSDFVLDSKGWDDIRAKSVFSIVRKELDWIEFKNDVMNDEIKSINVGLYGPFLYKLKNVKRQNVHADIYFYDFMGNEKKLIRLLMQKIENKWKVVGESKKVYVE